MIRNLFTVAWRNLVKQRFFTIINILGLAIGLASFILITLYVIDELRYDRHHEKLDRIYRVHSDIVFGGTELTLAVTADPMGEALKKDYPEVEEYTRIYNSAGSKQIRKGSNFITENDVAHADSTVFKVFTIPFVHGNPSTALTAPNSVVISEDAARKYFGKTSVVGESIETNDGNNTLYKITGVYKNMPAAGHFRFHFLFSMQNVQYDFGTYLSHNFYTYLLLKPGVSPEKFDQHFKSYVLKYVVPQAGQYMNIKSIEDFENAGNKISYSLMPVADIHLHSGRTPELGVNSDISYVYIFGAVAIFVLLLACVNFINLSTANSSARAKEIGIRKVLGAARSGLVRQFLSESTLTAFLATLLAIGIAIVSLNYFNSLSGKELSFSDFVSPLTIGIALLLILTVGFLAGSYPAFYIAGFETIAALKGRLKLNTSKSYLRNGLVVFQFVIAIMLMVGTLVVYTQLKYIRNARLGFNKDQVLVLNSTSALGNQAESFLNEAREMKGVKAASFAGYLPVSNSSRSDNTFSKEAIMLSDNSFNMQNWRIDEEYIPTLGMQMVQGRNFDRSYGSDSTGVILNETAAALLGGGNVIGRKLYRSRDEGPQELTVVGVVQNFNYESLRQNVGPLCFLLGRPRWAMALRLDGTEPASALINKLEAKFKGLAQGRPFEYEFLDASFDKMYRAEQRTSGMALGFSIIAIAIACMGLFGLATYMARQRIKEIGVRKVLGASVTGITAMLSTEFLKLVGFAIVIALPLSYFIMSRWLQDFAHRTSISWLVMVSAALCAVAIALITVSFQAIRAALVNPVKSLRTE